MPLSEAGKKTKAVRDAAVKAVISGEDRRKIVVVGPCSADNAAAVLDYVSRLKEIESAVSEKLLIVPRIFSNKPRTRGDGYKGMLHNPDPLKETDVERGIISVRTLHIKCIEDYGLSAADELLYPDCYGYFEDLLSYATIGARSCENPEHRFVASGAEIAVGIKNSVCGSLNVLSNSVRAAQSENEFKYGDCQVRTCGNPFAHAVLRGRTNDRDENIPNYRKEDILTLYGLYSSAGLKNPAVIIDTGHANSNKDPFAQTFVARDVIKSMRESDVIASFVKGFMIESYIEDGNQPIGGKEYGKSITDPCLGIEKTRRLIYELAESL